MNKELIKTKDINFGYGRVKILNHLDLVIGAGKFVSIIGPNGSGKTTLLKLLAGITNPDSGMVQYLGQDLKTLPHKKRAKEFSIIFQHNHSRFPFTCLEMVMLGRYPHRNRLDGYSEKEIDFVLEIMRKTETIEYARKMITEISGGELQRVIIARALAQNPRVIFMDEAFSELDICAKVRCIRLLKNLIKEDGLSVISIMHDLNMAYMFSDDVIALKKGKVEGYGHPHRVMDNKLMRNVFNIDVEVIENKGFFINAQV